MLFFVWGKELGGNLRKCHWNVVFMKTQIMHFRNNSASNTSLSHLMNLWLKYFCSNYNNHLLYVFVQLRWKSACESYQFIVVVSKFSHIYWSHKELKKNEPQDCVEFNQLKRQNLSPISLNRLSPCIINVMTTYISSNLTTKCP
jgi:hypothetical protein